MSAQKERLKLEEQESHYLLSGRRFPSKDQPTVCPSLSEDTVLPKGDSADTGEE